MQKSGLMLARLGVAAVNQRIFTLDDGVGL